MSGVVHFHAEDHMSPDSEPEIVEERPPGPQKGGLIMGVGLILALVLLVYLNMG